MWIVWPGTAAGGTTVFAGTSKLVAGVFVLVGLSFGALFVWITRDDRLLQRLPPPEVVRAARLRFTLGEAVYLLALGLSFVWPPAALALHAAMALYYAFDQASVPATPAPPVRAGPAAARPP